MKLSKFILAKNSSLARTNKMLELEKVNSGYGKVHILWDVSFQIKEKEIVSIIGPNGAGKTTLVKTIKDRRYVQDTKDRVFQIFPVLKKKEKAQAQTLSGGEQQMLVICRSLMSNPQLLILDEPSLGLAPIIVEKVLDTVRTINEEGVTILLVEQNIRESLDVADRGYVLEEGKIILEGKSRELLSNSHIKEVYLGL